ncbi:TBC1 domain family member 7-like [Dreissena polymorpha]|uniref:TBC1 domain family member 7 n=1 Tax=Dreissena polymorpha TaxID=45954 RepID=A0A9D4R946_DREPO|nr:TBC1 domain family member 7-like [Dreissena polymorpha]XP_052270439.1 TBC1 domain family member 7-like [Dreissena polymorpha]XP_052270440.1 TBC1 domain family member 7-like [Dreissena polymorpha]XP_052270441.1 TBC1 domain family member 7-like [Dreissena polymorpha]XP_052270442.1 TBC1 domain family member 7-like [Dreissena polymorpha]XP_052270443.1 TBC1 domain family member 7-like [Dreissena polymorpha]XP_052270444.1 TBC1 domain family member 7-like [Dreissena polymorpha]XP_052270445.1 TBC
MSDDQNFRKNFYKKVGFRTFDEKHAIETLLKDKPLDIDKLRLYCLRCPVSAKYRVYLWKVVLGVIPASQDSHEFVMKNRQEQYDLLKSSLEVMRRIHCDTPVVEVFLKMFLIEEGLLPFHDSGLCDQHSCYMSIAQLVSQMAESNIEAYWITNKFYRMFSRSMKDVLPTLPEKVKTLLKKEDTDCKLWNHLAKHELWQILPLKRWFSTCFAAVLPEIPFERVVDKVLGGSVMILVYVAVSLLITLKRPLLTMASREDMIQYLTQVPEDTGDILVNNAIDLWEKQGHHMTKSDSPGPINRSPS